MDHGRCRIEKIYAGENWNPDLRAPLSGPGIDVHEGDYLLAVNGKQLDSSMNPYSLFEQSAGKQTVLTVNAKPSMHGAREVTVVPVYSELALRRKNWIEETEEPWTSCQAANWPTCGCLIPVTQDMRIW